MVAVTFMWQWIFNYNYGVLNAVLRNLGIIEENINWLGTESLFMPVMYVILIWSGTGFNIILLMAAMTNVNRNCYEAADIEGATAWEKLWKITIPMISPTILVVVIYSIIDSFTDYNNQIMRMIDEYAGNINYEYSTTIGLVYFLVILVLVGLVNLIMGRFIHYSVD